MKEFNISGKVLGLILICVIAVSGVVFATTIVGTSGTSAVPNYNDNVIAVTTTNFVNDVSNGYKEPVIEVSTSSESNIYGSSSSGSSSGSASTMGGSRFYLTLGSGGGYTTGTGPVHWPSTPRPSPINPTSPSHF